jgi:Ca-activated chloride channel family protein
MRVSLVTITLVGALMSQVVLADQQARPEVVQTQQPTFRSGVSMVTVAAVVRDRKGRLVPSLTRDQFQVLDRGEVRAIRDFRPDNAPVSVALLLDASGSMSVAANMEAAKRAAGDLLATLQVERDESALFAFDTRLSELEPFSNRQKDVQRTLNRVEAFGMTSLHDAIAETARRVAVRGGAHRAVIVLTDGIDTASRLTADQVASMASSIDVPIYILAVVSPLDHPGLAASLTANRPGPLQGDLANLAVWTGGGLFISSRPEDSQAAAKEIMAELRHQYLLAFEPGTQPGWHRLEIRVRDSKLTVRARSGYVAAPREGN